MIQKPTSDADLRRLRTVIRSVDLVRELSEAEIAAYELGLLQVTRQTVEAKGNLLSVAGDVQHWMRVWGYTGKTWATICQEMDRADELARDRIAEATAPEGVTVLVYGMEEHDRHLLVTNKTHQEWLASTGERVGRSLTTGEMKVLVEEAECTWSGDKADFTLWDETGEVHQRVG